MEALDHTTYLVGESPGLISWIGPGLRDASQLFSAADAEVPRLDRRIGPHRLVLLNDAAEARHVLAQSDSAYRLSNLEKRLVGPIVGEGLTVAEGKSWARQRKVATRVVSDARMSLGARFEAWLQRAAPQMGETVQASPERWLPALEVFTLQALSQAMFGDGPRCSGPDLQDAISAVREEMSRFDLADGLGLHPALASPKMHRLRRLARVFDAEILSQLTERGEDSAWPELGADPKKRRDFTVAMITSFEATSLTLFWCLAVAQERARAAARAGDREDLQCIIRETLRLYPPFPFILRVARRPDKSLAPHVPAGALVCISPYFLHRRAAYWSQPNFFQPERFSKVSANPAYLPFGAGPRACSGARLALPLLEKLLAAVVLHWRVQIEPGSDLSPRLGVTLRPRGPVRATLEPVTA